MKNDALVTCLRLDRGEARKTAEFSMEAMRTMGKIDIAAIECARAGRPAR